MIAPAELLRGGLRRGLGVVDEHLSAIERHRGAAPRAQPVDGREKLVEPNTGIYGRHRPVHLLKCPADADPSTRCRDPAFFLHRASIPARASLPVSAPAAICW